MVGKKGRQVNDKFSKRKISLTRDKPSVERSWMN